jgi:Gpi18-like mannosyltransferase
MTEITRSTIKSYFVSATRLLSRDDWVVAGWVMAMKVLLLLLGATSYSILWNTRLDGTGQWFEIWNRWDTGIYEQIAQFGYTGGDFLRSFYPLFPWLVRLIAHLGTSYFVAALIVSGIASIVAVILLRRLVELDYPATVAMRSVWFLLIFPTAYFLHIGYSESLFLALALASMLAARADRWLLAGVLGAFCWMTRAPGAVLVPTLAVEAAQQWWVKRRWNWSWVWIAIVPAGFAVYLLINWRVSGNPFGFLQARKEIFEQSFALPLRGIRQAIWAHYHSK